MSNVDALLNTAGFVANQASTISVDGQLTSGDKLTGAVVSLQYDPAQVTLSNLHTDTATSWSLSDYKIDATAGTVRASLSNSDGQASNGPILLFTVTPANGSVSITSCSVLKLVVGNADSNLADQNFDSWLPSDTCAGYGPMRQSGGTGPTTGGKGGSGGTMGMQADRAFIGCIDSATRALRIAGGLLAATPEDLDALDRDLDERITLLDAVSLMNTPCSSIAKGWYTFQGNRRRTGRTSSSIPSNATAKWSTPYTNNLVYKNVGGTDRTLDITPSLLAVPDPAQPSSGLPILFATLSDGVSTSRVYRLQDNGDHYTVTGVYNFPLKTVYSPPGDTTVYYTMATGTPLYFNGRLYVTANETFTINAGGSNQTTYTQGQLFVLGVTGTGSTLPLANLGTGHPNPVPLSNTASAVDAGLTYCSPALNPLNNGILVTANQPNSESQNGSGFDGYLYCKDSGTGADLWTNLTRLYANDVFDHVSDDTPEVPVTYSSPAIYGSVAYVANTNAQINARNLVDGSIVLDQNNNDASYQTVDANDMFCAGSVSAFNGRLYTTFQDDDRDTYPNPGGAACVDTHLDPTAQSGLWNLDFLDVNTPNFALTTPAVRAEHPSGIPSGILIFGDDYGVIHGVGTEPDVFTHQPTITWPTSPVTDNGYGAYIISGHPQVRCSALVAGVPGGAGTVLIGADNGSIYVLNADTGAYLSTLGPLNGKIRSSMAAYQGRLYVLSTAVSSSSGGTALPAQLQCHAAP